MPISSGSIAHSSYSSGLPNDPNAALTARAVQLQASWISTIQHILDASACGRRTAGLPVRTRLDLSVGEVSHALRLGVLLTACEAPEVFAQSLPPPAQNLRGLGVTDSYPTAQSNGPQHRDRPTPPTPATAYCSRACAYPPRPSPTPRRPPVSRVANWGCRDAKRHAPRTEERRYNEALIEADTAERNRPPPF